MTYNITTKAAGVRLYAGGFFGNHLRQWDTLESLEQEPRKPTTVVIRECGSGGGGVSVAGVAYEDIVPTTNGLLKEKPSANLYYGEAIEEQQKYIRFQGEYMNGSNGEHLTYTTVKDYFRPAMEKGKQVYKGPGCRLFLRAAMDHRSYENFENMVECFPDHIIEFSVMNRPCGCDGLNTIIWEVRAY